MHLLETQTTQALRNVLLQAGCPDRQRLVLSQNPRFEHEGQHPGRCWPEKRVSISKYYVLGKIPRKCHHELRLRNGCMWCLVQLPISYTNWASINCQRKSNLPVVRSQLSMDLCSSAIGPECRSPYMARQERILMLIHLRRFLRRVEGICDWEIATSMPRDRSPVHVTKIGEGRREIERNNLQYCYKARVKLSAQLTFHVALPWKQIQHKWDPDQLSPPLPSPTRTLAWHGSLLWYSTLIVLLDCWYAMNLISRHDISSKAWNPQDQEWQRYRLSPWKCWCSLFWTRTCVWDWQTLYLQRMRWESQAEHS